MKLIDAMNKLVKLDDMVEIVGLSGKRLMLCEAMSVPVMYLRCECTNVKFGIGYTFTIV